MIAPENALESATHGESNFGARLRRLREQRQLKQTEVAELTGIPPAYISLIENGKLIPAGDWARRIREVLGWPAEAIIVAATLEQNTVCPRRRVARRSLSIEGALWQELDRARAMTGWQAGYELTWTDFLKMLLLYWQAYPPRQLPTQNELRDWYHD